MKTYYIIGWAHEESTVGQAKVIDCFSASSINAAKRQLNACALENKYRGNYHHFQLVERKALAIV